MRWALMAAYLAAAGIAIWVEARESPTAELALQIDPGYAVPEAGDNGNVVNHRLWLLRARVAVRSSKRCVQGNLEVRQNGENVSSGSWSSARSTEGIGGFGGYAGTALHLAATATCEAGPAAGLRGTSKTTIAIPRRVCTHAALRVLDVDGEADAGGKRLREGGVAPHEIHVKRGRVDVGAPECNGYHAILQRGTTSVGDYDPNGRGRAFGGRSVIVARADEHAGGFAPTSLPLQILPTGTQCPECPLSAPASFAVRSAQNLAAVRVYAGSVFVGHFNGRYLRVREGEQLFARCAPASTCRLEGPVLYQPGERFLLARRQPRPLARLIRSVERPPAELLVPERAEGNVVELRRHGTLKLLAVLWLRGVRTPPGHPIDEGKGTFVPERSTVSRQQGVIVWLRTKRGWRRVYSKRLPGWAQYALRAGDVTHDALDDVLLTQLEGSGGCGVRSVSAAVNGGVREIFRGSWCETGIEAHGGDLLVRTPYGPCPVQPGGAHCYGGVRNEELRWSGRRFVRSRVWVRCQSADLDPQRECRKRS